MVLALIEHLICFASEGASVMTGSKSGVSAVLLDMFPNIILWHCLNHRLELAVGDSLNEVGGINHFKAFLDTIYSLYSQSSKNLLELKSCATLLEAEIKKIGKVLDTRWPASSFSTVKAVWTSFAILAQHFESRSDGGKDAAKFRGLLSTVRNFFSIWP